MAFSPPCVSVGEYSERAGNYHGGKEARVRGFNEPMEVNISKSTEKVNLSIFIINFYKFFPSFFAFDCVVCDPRIIFDNN